MSNFNSTNRFSDRVSFYVKSRPSYPLDMMVHLRETGLLGKDFAVADIGSGTGISSKLFLDEGAMVFGVEPNKEMRQASESFLSGYSSFFSVDGTAENTSLKEKSVDLIVCAQAFHWFDRNSAKKEFNRILKDSGFVLIAWNDRENKDSEFMQAYDDFVKMFGTDYIKVNHQNISEAEITSFFKPGTMKVEAFHNQQQFNFAGLRDRVLSSSYMPDELHKDYEFMMYVLKKIFRRYQQDGFVTFEYKTRIYYGKI